MGSKKLQKGMVKVKSEASAKQLSAETFVAFVSNAMGS